MTALPPVAAISEPGARVLVLGAYPGLVIDRRVVGESPRIVWQTLLVVYPATFDSLGAHPAWVGRVVYAWQGGNWLGALDAPEHIGFWRDDDDLAGWAEVVAG